MKLFDFNHANIKTLKALGNYGSAISENIAGPCMLFDFAVHLKLLMKSIRFHLCILPLVG